MGNLAQLPDKQATAFAGTFHPISHAFNEAKSRLPRKVISTINVISLELI